MFSAYDSATSDPWHLTASRWGGSSHHTREPGVNAGTGTCDHLSVVSHLPVPPCSSLSSPLNKALEGELATEGLSIEAFQEADKGRSCLKPCSSPPQGEPPEPGGTVGPGKGLETNLSCHLRTADLQAGDAASSNRAWQVERAHYSVSLWSEPGKKHEGNKVRI